MAETTKGTFTCEKCKRSYVWKSQLAGKRVACKCGGRINVPVKPSPGKSAVAVTPPKKSSSKPTPVKPKAVAAPPPPPTPPTAWNLLDNLPEPSMFHSAILPGAHSKKSISARPGVLIVLGVFSMLVGLASALAGYDSAKIWRQIYQASVPRTILNAAEGPVLPPPTFPPYSGAVFRPTGLSQTECSQIAAVTPFDGPFAENRRDRLERLLAEAGTLIMPNLASDSLHPAPASTTAAADAPDRFLAPHGTITVHQDWAKYESDNQPNVFVDKNIATINGTTFLSLQAIDQTIRQLRNKLPKITNMQLGYVADYLERKPFEPNFRNANMDDNARNVVSSASLGGVKILAINIQGVDLLVLPNGRGTYKNQAPSGLDIMTNRTMFAPIKGFQPMMPGDPDYMFALSICCLVSVVLAVYLGLAGMITVIAPSRWARLHMAYAILSVVLILTEAGLAIYLYSSITPANAKAADPLGNAADIQRLITYAVPAVIYPLVLVAIYRWNPKLGRRG